MYCRFRVVCLSPERLQAEVWGEGGHRPRREIKAATYHDLSLRQTEGRWQGTVVFDV
ncbi:MAG: archease [Chloroflexi bacterium]|nr:archease [Chloroflexota bacterium]